MRHSDEALAITVASPALRSTQAWPNNSESSFPVARVGNAKDDHLPLSPKLTIQWILKF